VVAAASVTSDLFLLEGIGLIAKSGGDGRLRVQTIEWHSQNGDVRGRDVFSTGRAGWKPFQREDRDKEVTRDDVSCVEISGILRPVFCGLLGRVPSEIGIGNSSTKR
jgi:hypothetical protein